MASKALVPQNAHEERLVKLGKQEERERQKRKAEEDKADDMKAQRNEARRERDDAIAEADAGPKPSHKLIGAVSLLAGVGTGVAAQHAGLDKTTLPGWAKKGIAPTLGALVGIAGVAIDGIPGVIMSNFGFAEAAGSGGVSLVKKAIGG